MPPSRIIQVSTRRCSTEDTSHVQYTAGVSSTSASARANRNSTTRGLNGRRAPIACASHSHATSINSVQVNCSTWPPPQNSTS